MRSDPGDELQIVHSLELGAVAAMPVADLTLVLQEQEALRGQHRPEIPIFPLKAPFIFDEEPLEMMEQHPV
jgi:hypothetical protein